MSVLIYGPAIHEACATGDLDEMRKVAQQAEEHLAEAGDVSAALEALRAEIAKAERGSGGGYS